MLQIHADALDSECSTYHDFLLRYKSFGNIVYGIVEGKEDPMFYRGFIEHHLPNGWNVELIPAGKKDNVIGVISSFDWNRFHPKRIAFFVDRDLSYFVPENEICADNLYVTDNYSIENDVANFSVLRRLLEEAFNLAALEPAELALAEQSFTEARSNFCESMAPIMAQIILWRRNGCRPCLNDIRPKDFFCFSNGSISLRPDFMTTEARLRRVAECVNLHVSDTAALSGVEEEFRGCRGADRFTRGKYLLWFLVEFAIEFHGSVASILARFSKSPKARISISSSNAMVVVAPRARCPATLRSFFERTYDQYITETLRGCIASRTMSASA